MIRVLINKNMDDIKMTREASLCLLILTIFDYMKDFGGML
jgi:hypothetical protein